MGELEEMQDAARETIDGLRQALAGRGLKSVDAPHNPFGLGLGVAWGDDRYTVLGVASGDPGAVNIGSAVLRDVSRERPAILDVTNRLTLDNPLAPVVLHDAEAGWDVLVMQRFPFGVLMHNPGFFVNCVSELPQKAEQVRDQFQVFGGRRPSWTPQDLHELVIRVLL